MASQQVSVSREIAAPASVIFDILADPTRHSEIDGSGSVRGALAGSSTRLALGDKFGMKMKLLIPYDMRSTVVEFEEDRLIAWAHFGKHRWRYELEPIDDNTTRVTETFDWSTALVPKAIEVMGWPKRHPDNMAKTLERLEQVATAKG